MGTITQNLEKLVAAKSAIAAAIVAKGGTVNQGDGFEEFAADIATIPYNPPVPEPSLVQFTEWDDSWTISSFQSITGAIYYTENELPERIDIPDPSRSPWIICNDDGNTRFLIATYNKSTGEFYSKTWGTIDDIKSLLTKSKYFCYFAYVS